MTSSAGPGDGDRTAHRPSSDPHARREPRFTPGTVLAERYRIVALLGSGGMGEVYRADDTRIGQQVALKFLPHDVRRDPQRLERLYSEVRLGRQVSHPNVCRLYDVAEWEGNHFLAMEYVDGEDLASLLRRIGRLPVQKAFEIARDVCAGIAAAHALGIVHRDLKPANIMIDGRGQARITDFGLAVVADDAAGRREIAGTPAYMAPEQLSGAPATQKTDLYALGLVLYEIFTGRRLFESGESSARRAITRSLSSAASGDLDPVIQRVIARCVEEDPQKRPSSIHAVIASLPGGDPLQAAVDAGETPSPQMVAAAGEVGDLEPRTAWLLLAGGLLGLALLVAVHGRTVLNRFVPLPKPPDALADRARTILDSAGYARGYDRAYTFNVDDEIFSHVREKRPHDLWEKLPTVRPNAFVFAYRESPIPLQATGREGRVTDADPPVNLPGMTLLFLDSQGRLLKFIAVPPRQVPEGSHPPVDWSRFFEHAGGDLEGLKPVQSRWSAPVDNDARFAWEGTFRGDAGTPIRIEAASRAGKPVWFEVIGPWTSPLTDVYARSAVERGTQIFFALFTATLIITAIVLARRNLLRGRGDRRTAFRLAMVIVVAGAVGHLFRIEHVSDPGAEISLIERGIANALFTGLEAWIVYLALEPYVRRRWPHTLIGWSRLFAGRFRDPMIGRDLLIGLAAGPLLLTLRLLALPAPALFGEAKLPPFVTWVSPLVSSRNLVFALAMHTIAAIFLSLLTLFFLWIAYAVTRRRWAAMLLVGLVLTVGIGDPTDAPIYQLSAGLIMAAIVVFVLVRFGILAVAFTHLAALFVEAVPFTLDTDAWYFGRSLTVIVCLVGAMVYGFWSSLGEKPAFGVAALEEA